MPEIQIKKEITYFQHTMARSKQSHSKREEQRMARKDQTKT
jgi:hypothetical protein